MDDLHFCMLAFKLALDGWKFGCVNGLAENVNMCSMKTVIPGSFSPVCRSCRSILHLAMGPRGRRPPPPPPRQHPGGGDWRGRNL